MNLLQIRLRGGSAAYHPGEPDQQHRLSLLLAKAVLKNASSDATEEAFSVRTFLYSASPARRHPVATCSAS